MELFYVFIFPVNESPEGQGESINEFLVGFNVKSEVSKESLFSRLLSRDAIAGLRAPNAVNSCLFSALTDNRYKD